MVYKKFVSDQPEVPVMLQSHTMVKATIIFLTFNSGITDEDIKDYDTEELLGLLRSLAEYRPGDVRDDDVTFYLHTRQASNRRIPIESRGGVDVNKTSKLIIHGWMDNHNRSWYRRLTDEYLKRDDFNVVQVDWWRVARSFYLSSAHNIRLVGTHVADFILGHSLVPKSVHLIGHSLGAHIAGFASEIIRNKTGGRVRRITGLDPAGPAFLKLFVGQERRLQKDDADVVDVIHTDGGFLGYYPPIGTFDVYINGGTRVQPDCHLNLTDISHPGELFEDSKRSIAKLQKTVKDTYFLVYCSHTRSYVRFTEIINNKKYTCKRCNSLLQYMVGLCSHNEKYSFGAEDINESTTGVCFVDTANAEV